MVGAGLWTRIGTAEGCEVAPYLWLGRDNLRYCVLHLIYGWGGTSISLSNVITAFRLHLIYGWGGTRPEVFRLPGSRKVAPYLWLGRDGLVLAKTGSSPLVAPYLWLWRDDKLLYDPGSKLWRSVLVKWGESTQRVYH